jgi:hypothetical protein
MSWISFKEWATYKNTDFFAYPMFGVRESELSGTIIYVGGTEWHSWLKNCTTNQEVMGSTVVTDIFHRLNPTGCTTALESTQPLAGVYPGVYQGYLLWSKSKQCVWLTTLAPSCADCLEILGA